MASTPWNGNTSGVGGSKAKMPSMGDTDIFWNHTVCLQNPSTLTDKHTDKVRRVIKTELQ